MQAAGPRLLEQARVVPVPHDLRPPRDIYIYIYICVYIYIYIYVICIYVYMYICIYAYMYIAGAQTGAMHVSQLGFSVLGLFRIPGPDEDLVRNVGISSCNACIRMCLRTHNSVDRQKHPPARAPGARPGRAAPVTPADEAGRACGPTKPAGSPARGLVGSRAGWSDIIVARMKTDELMKT